MPAIATDDRPGAAPPRPGTGAPGLAGRVTWRHAAVWVGLAAVAVLATLVVLDNFVLVEVRLPGADVRARLGWVVVTSTLVGFAVGWAVGRSGRARVSRSDRGPLDEG